MSSSSPMLAPTMKLNNGVQIPVIGLGTFQLHGESCVNAVKWALECGYRHIDTAAIYKNEEFVAEGIKKAKVKRSDVFITSKLTPYKQSYEGTIYTVEKSLENLKTDYIDLYLIHWPGTARIVSSSPNNSYNRKQCWMALEKLYKEGKIKAIGVSNYYEKHIHELLTYCTVKPVLNQIEFHPFLYLHDLKILCESNDIKIEAYSSFGNGQLLNHPTINQIANECSLELNRTITSAQILLQWGNQQHCIVIPKSKKKENILSNFQQVVHPSHQFNLSESRMKQLNDLHCNMHTSWDPTPIL